MRIFKSELKIYFVTATVLSIFIVLMVQSTSAFSIQCEAGGPYAKNATINILGNVTDNSQGAVSNVSTNISVSGTQQTSSNTTSDGDGTYHTSHFLNFDFNTYNVVVEAKANTTSIYCTDTIQVQLGVNTSCANRVVYVEGLAIYSANASYVNAGTATVGISEVSVSNSSSVNSTGGFKVPVTACIKSGTLYTLNVIVDDNLGKRSSLQEHFIAP